MSGLTVAGRVTGWTCIAIGGLQLLGGTRGEPGMTADATVDSHVRFMGPMFIGYGIDWLHASTPLADLNRMRLLAALMAVGGAGRLITRTTIGRPHRFHDVLLLVELAAPIVVEALGKHEHPTS